MVHTNLYAEPTTLHIKTPVSVKKPKSKFNIKEVVTEKDTINHLAHTNGITTFMVIVSGTTVLTVGNLTPVTISLKRIILTMYGHQMQVGTIATNHIILPTAALQ